MTRHVGGDGPSTWEVVRRALDEVTEDALVTKAHADGMATELAAYLDSHGYAIVSVGSTSGD